MDYNCWRYCHKKGGKWAGPSENEVGQTWERTWHEPETGENEPLGFKEEMSLLEWRLSIEQRWMRLVR